MSFPHGKNASHVADRLCRLYSRGMRTEISAAIFYPDPNASNLPPVAAAAADDDVTRERVPACLGELPVLLELSRRQARANAGNPSDHLPTVTPVHNFENGIETAMLGGKVRWLGTRYHTYGEPVDPLIADYRDFDWLLPDDNNAWLQRYLDAYRYFVANGEGNFAIEFPAFSVGMNLPVQLRGAQRAYLDMYEEPENLQRLLDYSLRFTADLYRRVEEIVGEYNRTLYGDHALAEYRVDRQPAGSVDAYSLCAPGTLRKWGMREIAEFNGLAGGASLHIHENSRQVIEEVAEIPGWRMVAFTDAPGYPRSFDVRWELRRRMRDIPIQIGCARDEFRKALESRGLPGNTQYAFGVGSVSEAERIMDKVQSYEAPDCV
jgi:hypothetical protein